MQLDLIIRMHWKAIYLGTVVRRLISTNPGLNFNPGVFFSLSIALSQIISSVPFGALYHQIVDEKN